MRWSFAVALVVLGTTFGVAAQESRWTVDASAVGFVEAWDLNDEREQLHGLVAGANFRAWRGLALRGEAVRVLVGQRGSDAWLTAGWIGARAGITTGRLRPFAELGGGRAAATHSTPPNGTRWNYVLVAGAGLEIPLPGPYMTLGVRWFHVSNNGSEGRGRNPDIQALGGLFGLGWRF